MNLKKIIQSLSSILLIIIFPIEILAQQNKITSDLRWRNIGPSNMMGRIAAIDAVSYTHLTLPTNREV